GWMATMGHRASKARQTAARPWSNVAVWPTGAVFSMQLQYCQHVAEKHPGGQMGKSGRHLPGGGAGLVPLGRAASRPARTLAETLYYFRPMPYRCFSVRTRSMPLEMAGVAMHVSPI